MGLPGSCWGKHTAGGNTRGDLICASRRPNQEACAASEVGQFSIVWPQTRLLTLGCRENVCGEVARFLGDARLQLLQGRHHGQTQRPVPRQLFWFGGSTVPNREHASRLLRGWCQHQNNCPQRGDERLEGRVGVISFSAGSLVCRT